MDNESGIRGTSARTSSRPAFVNGAAPALNVKVLRTGALIAVVLWLVAVITSFWAAWDPFVGSGTIQLAPGNRFVTSLATALNATWGYMLVAVIAYAGAGLLAHARKPPAGSAIE